MLKKILSVFICMLMLLPLAACGSAKSDDSAEAEAVEVITIAYFTPHLENPFMNRMADAVKKYVADADYELIHYVANNDAALQSEQILSAVSENVDAIILGPCSFDALADAVKKAKDAGIPVVTLHENISTQEDCVSFTGPDFENGGKQAMTRAMNDLPDGGNIAILYGAEGHSAQISISAGYPEALSAAPDKYPVVAKGFGNWIADDAKALVTGWLNEGKEIDAVVCNNDGMATGVLEAVTEAGLAGQIHIYGLDAQTNILDAIKLGTVQATVYVDFDTQAKQSVEIIKDVLAGKKVDAEYLSPMILITAKNVDKYLQ